MTAAPAVAASAAPTSFADALTRDLKSPRFLAMAALVVACCVVYTKATLGEEAQPYVLVAIALSAFALGSSSGIDPRHAVGLGGFVVAVGIALVGTSPSQAGAALCLAGGLALAGGIHRLGRMGPEEGHEPVTSAESFTRAKT